MAHGMAACRCVHVSIAQNHVYLIVTEKTHSNEVVYISVITKLPNSEQSYKGKVKTHNYINRQNQSTTGKL
jgi:hypothetical protein